jgi:hypothetical protein
VASQASTRCYCESEVAARATVETGDTRGNARPLRYRRRQPDARTIMSQRRAPWFWNTAVLARLAGLLLAALFAVYATRMLAQWG